MTIISGIRAVSPFGPIFAKELRTTARRKRTYLLRVLYLGGLLLALLWAYAIAGLDRRASLGVAQRQAELGRMGTAFFSCFAFFLVISMALIGPILTCTAIGAERLSRTLHVLLMTPINAWQIVSGKLFSRLWIALTLIGLGLPVLALVRLLGSVELHQIFGVICLGIVVVLTTAAIGLFYSSFMDRAYAVILLSYATLALLYLFVPMAIVLLMNAMDARPSNSMGILSFMGWINPFVSMGFIVAPAPRGLLPGTWQICCLGHVGFSALLVWGAAAAIRKFARRAGERPMSAASQRQAIEAREAEAAWAFMPPAATLPDATEAGSPPLLSYRRTPRPVRGERGVGDNPVLWREVRRPLMPRRWQAVLATTLCLGLLLFTYAGLSPHRGLRDRETHVGFALAFDAGLLLLACVLSATAVSQEKETDTWTLLLTTPLSAGQIVWGKVLGVLRRLMWPFALVVFHFGVFALFNVITWTSFFTAVWVILTFNLIWVATGVSLSLRLRKVTLAVIANLMLPVLFYAVAPLASFLIGTLVFHDQDWAEWTLWYMPFSFLTKGITAPASSSYFYYDPPYGGRYWLPLVHSVDGASFHIAVFLAGCIMTAAAITVVTVTIARFNAIVGRASQRQTLPLAEAKFFQQARGR